MAKGSPAYACFVHGFRAGTSDKGIPGLKVAKNSVVAFDIVLHAVGRPSTFRTGLAL
jgi:hypothetical protein